MGLAAQLKSILTKFVPHVHLKARGTDAAQTAAAATDAVLTRAAGADTAWTIATATDAESV